MSYYMILRPSTSTATGELAEQITEAEKNKMLKDGTAVMLHDGILREVKPAAAPKAEKAKRSTSKTYATKDMKAEG